MKNNGVYLAFIKSNIYLIKTDGVSPMLSIISIYDFKSYMQNGKMIELDKSISKGIISHLNDKNAFFISLFEVIKIPIISTEISIDEDPINPTMDDIKEWTSEFIKLKKDGLSNEYVRARMSMDHCWNIDISEFVFTLVEK